MTASFPLGFMAEQLTMVFGFGNPSHGSIKSLSMEIGGGFGGLSEDFVASNVVVQRNPGKRPSAVGMASIDHVWNTGTPIVT